MAYAPYPPGYPAGGYQPGFFTPAVPDQLAQLRQNQQMQNMQNMQQLPQPPVMQPQPAPQQNNGMIWVSGKAEADGYLVAPNSAVPLWDANNPVIYLRQADSTGKPFTKVYDLVERTDMQPQQQAAPPVDLSGYVKWDELEPYLAERFKRPSKAAKPKEETDNG